MNYILSDNQMSEIMENVIYNFYRCIVHSDIHTVHSPTDAHLIKL